MATKSTKAYSSIQESMIADSLGWEVVPGSGARPCIPGDIISDEWLGECKTHVADTKIFFDLNVWKKIQEEAMMRHRKPALFVDDGMQSLKSTWVVCCKGSINCTFLLTTPLPFHVRKNITFDNFDGKQILRELFKNNGNQLFDCICFSANWNGCDVLIMPFETFKELYTR